MTASSARDRCLYCLGIIATICLTSQIVMAGDSALFNRISPHISLYKNAPSQERQSFSTTETPQLSSYTVPGGDYAPPAKKNMGDHDLFSLALGARFQISDWLGVGAAFSMPLAEEETVWRQDLAIEAMVTMQF